ncbi:MAG: FAD-dependent monooxygenase [Deltaproteobacteria bacterium]|nr:FAD-dependent monooxygenase [Deltaproteobacteria bacterium]
MTTAQGVDVAVVGSGPAGMSTAISLKRLAPQLSVVVLEKSVHPRPKLCGGGVLGRAVPLFNALGLDLHKAPVEAVRAGHVDIRFRQRQITLSEPEMVFVFERSALDHWLVRSARGHGIDIREHSPVRAISGKPGGFSIETTSGATIQAKVIVGADGVGSIVRRTFVEPVSRGLSQLVQVEAPLKAAPPDTLRFDFTAIHDGVNGYSWLFPERDTAGNPVAKIGVYSRHGRSPVPLRDYCIRTASRYGYDVSPKQVHHWSFREFAAGHSRYSAPGVLLVGDAAGSDPLVAEGIRQAIWWGQLAAEHICRKLGQDGDVTLRGYERAVNSSGLGIELKRNRFFADMLYSPLHPVGLAAGFYEPRILEKVFAWVAGRNDYENLTAAETAKKAIKAVGRRIIGLSGPARRR